MLPSAMRKHLLLVLMLAAFFAVGYIDIQAQSSGIFYPPETEVVRGTVEISGTADHPDFWKYELAAAPFGTQNWFNITVSETPVRNGVLGNWDTRTVSDGTFTLRLRVVRRVGNYDEFTTQRVLVGNALPSPTPTLEVTPAWSIAGASWVGQRALEKERGRRTPKGSAAPQSVRL